MDTAWELASVWHYARSAYWTGRIGLDTYHDATREVDRLAESAGLTLNDLAKILVVSD